MHKANEPRDKVNQAETGDEIPRSAARISESLDRIEGTKDDLQFPVKICCFCSDLRAFLRKSALPECLVFKENWAAAKGGALKGV